MKKKKTIADVGTVLQKVKDQTRLKPWIDFITADEVLKDRFQNNEELQKQWMDPTRKYQAFTATDPKGTKSPGFDYEYGLVVFSTDSARDFFSKPENGLSSVTDPDLDNSGIVHFIYAKEGHKTAAKYILTATERFVSDFKNHLMVIVGEKDVSTQRFLKQLEYAELMHGEKLRIYKKSLAKSD